MLECAIHPITYRGEGILATVVKIWYITSLAKTPFFLLTALFLADITIISSNKFYFHFLT